MKTLKYLICYIIYPFSFLFVRKKNVWAFGSPRNAFSDNSKYLFVYVSENMKHIDAVWLSYNKQTVNAIREKGLKAEYLFSFKGLRYALKSKYWFFNAYTSDIMFCLSGGAKCVNLWHGVGLKKIEFNITSGVLAKRYVQKTFKERFYHPEVFRKPDFFISSTDFQSVMFIKAFRLGKENCLNFGYPRNEILTADENKRLDFINKYEPENTKLLIQKISAYKNTFIYMPTWRDSQRDIFSNMKLDILNEILQTNNELLILKPHFNTKISDSDIKGLSNIMLLDNNVDTYTILPYTSTLITDYSSILYDYILMENKNVILYLYDYDEYVKERDFTYPFDENVTGKIVANFNDLCEIIRNGDYKINPLDRSRIIEKFWGETQSASKRIAEYFDKN
ncbi:MAG: CDP-glycerol glycerophosphotransferase family protein [Bacteroidales bacterium]|nr:CDP-glycerol glycerophosphotransferase family protein [Bacteroidales bacterium]